MKYCENCGAELNDNAKFCDECGATQEKTVVEASVEALPKTSQRVGIVEKKSGKSVVVAIVVTIIVIAAIAAVILYLTGSFDKGGFNEPTDKKHIEQQGDDKEAQKDNEVKDKQDADNEAIKKAYKAKLSDMESLSPGDHMEYSVFDINQDGVRELIILVDNSEADKNRYIYSYKDGVVFEMGKIGAGHRSMGVDEDGNLYSMYMHMGYISIDKVIWDDSSKMIAEGNVFYSEELGLTLSEVMSDMNITRLESKALTDYSLL